MIKGELNPQKPPYMEKEDVFKSLVNILTQYSSSLQIIHDKPGNYYTHTPSNPASPKGEFYGAVQVKKNYVAFHLMPVYYHQELLDKISPELRQKMHGKSCFNFNQLDNQLLADLDKLTKAAFSKYKKLGKII
jgi:hypothetical protein